MFDYKGGFFLLLDDDNYPRKDIINFTDDTFRRVFGDEIKMLKFDYSNGGMGFYAIEYLIIKTGYKMRFEHERLSIGIEVTNEKNVRKSDWELGGKDELKWPVPRNVICEENIVAVVEYVYKKLIVEGVTF